MSSSVAKAGGKAIYAAQAFLPKPSLSKTANGFSLLREITIGATLGIAAGFVWKTYHWNEKRRIAEYYSALAQKEQEDEAAYTADLRSKLKSLEEELLA
ncbi:cytochrome c oxidase subunit 5C [Raphidocelis subcapitata]|uniref:Cytochrome c oxidase subunit 5C n=1 Tax=Raphidocelis subcapitata TaxID=307507 RepID=A0A2V0PK91_9CHLO|nr:cytochrome c oxidase subunit 5C [Raphidocelis subcapitata]|eukprot:GBF99959.1 cytochrome c oxidase subunit 5C [Raphidocelis subcapitata]